MERDRQTGRRARAGAVKGEERGAPGQAEAIPAGPGIERVVGKGPRRVSCCRHGANTMLEDAGSIGSPFASLTRSPGTFQEARKLWHKRHPEPWTDAERNAFLLSGFREKDNVKGRQECLPHLHTRFLNRSTSHCPGVELIDSRIKQLSVTIHE